MSEAPVIDLNGATLAYTENGPASPIAPAATVTDVDTAIFDGGTLTVGFGGTGTESDRLIILGAGNGAGQIGIVGHSVRYEGVEIGTFTGGTDGFTPLVVTLNGAATLAAVQALVRAVGYSNPSDNPATTPRTIDFVVDDGDGGTSATAQAPVGVTAVNDTPVNTVPTEVLASEDQPEWISGLSIADPDLNGEPVTVTLTVAHGTLSVSDFFLTGDISNNHTSSVTIFSLTGVINLTFASPDGLIYTPDPGYVGPDSLIITTNDGGFTGTDPGGDPGSEEDVDVIPITVAEANEAPVILVGGGVSGNEEEAVAIDGITISDVGTDPATGRLTVHLSAANGTLTLRTDVVGGIGAGDVRSADSNAGGTAVGTGLIVTASPDQINATLSAAGGLTYLGLTDFAGADALDLSVYEGTPASPAVFHSLGPGFFPAPGAILLADLDGDGSDEIIIGHGGPSGTIAVSGPSPAAFAVAGAPRALAAGDFNGDGVTDIAFGAYDSAGSIGFVDGDSGAVVTVAAVADVVDMLAADLNGDGWTDLAGVTEDGEIVLALRDSAATFAAPVSFGVSDQGPVSLAAGDLDGDANLDLLVANAGGPAPGTGSGSIDLLLGDGDGGFAAPLRLVDSASVITAGVLADFDGDGALDFAFASNDTNGDPNAVNGVQVVLGDGAGGFAAPVVYASAPGALPADLLANDVNGDGIVDLVVADGNETGTVSIRIGNGNGTFLPATTLATGAFPRLLGMGDPDGDGDLDLLAGHLVDTIEAFNNDSDRLSTHESLGITLAGVSDAPIVTDATLPAVPEDPAATFGVTVASLFSGRFTDPDNPAATINAIAVVENLASAATEGRWQYSTDVGASWFDIGAVATATALVLDEDARIRFVPVANFNGAPTALEVRGLDSGYVGGETAGAARVTLDTSVNGGATAISAATAAIDTFITPVNDAPSVTDTTLAAVAEDAVPAGATVAALFSSHFSDPDDPGETLNAIAVTQNAASASQGRWQYSTNGGTSWFDVGTVAASTALVLDDGAHLRFLPAANFNGTPAGLQVRGLDASYAGGLTAGAARVTLNVGAGGGTTAISASTATIATSVTALNDAPSVADATLPSIAEDSAGSFGVTVASLFAGRFSDPDNPAATLNALAIVQNGASAATEGRWQYSTDAAVSWFDVGAVATATALVLNEDARLRFVPAVNFNGAPTPLQVRGLDSTYAGGQTSGATRVTLDTGTNGGATAISASTAAIGIVITPVSDPGVANADSFATNEATPVSGNLFANNGSGADADPDGLAIATVNGSAASVGSTILLSSGATLRVNADGTFTYNPNGAFNATPLPSTGASNTLATDGFTYTLAGGESAAVMIGIAGLDSNDLIVGTAGNDTLSVDNGSDTLVGLAGNDVYGVKANSQVVEAVGGGSDRVLTGVSFQLTAGAEVELLSAANQSATTALNLAGNEFGQTIFGNSGVNSLLGLGGNDQLWGLAGNDGLDGGAGNDVTIGGPGDDVHSVDGLGDAVLEAAGEGNDRVLASSTYRLGGSAEVELLSSANQSDTTALDLSGNGYAQSIFGNQGANSLHGLGGNDQVWGLGGNDILDGGTGDDVAVGVAGDDIYAVDGFNDAIIDGVGQGSDRVLASSSYRLGGAAEVELVSTSNQLAGATIDLTGNGFAQIMFGNAGVNVLQGAGGNDTLWGLAGNDTLDGGTGDDVARGGTGDDIYAVDGANDQIFEAAGEGSDRVLASVSFALSAGVEVELLSVGNQSTIGAVDLTGNEFAQILFGNEGANLLSGLAGNDSLSGLGGNDVLDGGAGNDNLTGGNGADQFRFSATVAAANADLIVGYVAADDLILLDDAVFAGLALGTLNGGAFVLGTAAQDADDRILYDTATGNLFFDSDGTGAGAAILFATLQGAPTIAASEFVVI